jgi:hypothetical protein
LIVGQAVASTIEHVNETAEMLRLEANPPIRRIRPTPTNRAMASVARDGPRVGIEHFRRL